MFIQRDLMKQKLVISNVKDYHQFVCQSILTLYHRLKQALLVYDLNTTKEDI